MLIWMFVISVFIFSILWYEVENYTGWISLLIFVGGIFVIYKFTPDFNRLINFLISNPWESIGYILSWFLIGTVVAVFKWWRYCIYRARKLEEIEKSGANSSEKYQYSRPIASENKGRFMTWASWWPITLTVLLIRDPITRMFEEIYYRISGLLEKISIRAYKNVPSFQKNEELKKAVEDRNK